MQRYGYGPQARSSQGSSVRHKGHGAVHAVWHARGCSNSLGAPVGPVLCKSTHTYTHAGAPGACQICRGVLKGERRSENALVMAVLRLVVQRKVQLPRTRAPEPGMYSPPATAAT
jgi:hypothetical protein